jgi:hypothetical protein
MCPICFKLTKGLRFLQKYVFVPRETWNKVIHFKKTQVSCTRVKAMFSRQIQARFEPA